MSLDVVLTIPGAQLPVDQERICVRDAGQTKSISRAEWDARSPDREPVTVHAAHATTDTVYHATITHNLGAMARAAELAAAGVTRTAPVPDMR